MTGQTRGGKPATGGWRSAGFGVPSLTFNAFSLSPALSRWERVNGRGEHAARVLAFKAHFGEPPK